ncbi:hypothetical protein PENTCL1PPCAC_8733, partial [Pristionchus entomophagus]
QAHYFIGSSRYRTGSTLNISEPYWINFFLMKQMFLNRRGRVIDAALPGDQIFTVGVHGDAVYFGTADLKIFKAKFVPHHGIAVSYFRDVLQNERLNHQGLCTRVLAGRTSVYRSCDDPIRVPGIHIDIDTKELKKMKLRIIHRGKAIYMPEFPDRGAPQLIRISMDAYCSEGNLIPTYARDSSPYFYMVQNIADNPCLKAFDTDTMEFLELVRLPGLENVQYIAGVHNGIVTAVGKKGGESCFVKKELPRSTFTKEYPPSNVSGPTMKVAERQKEQSRETPVAIDDLSDQLCCSICSETFDSVKFIPRILDCGHTFCEVCIYRLRSDRRVKCPVCQRITDLPDEKELIRNFSMIGMSEQLMKMRTERKVERVPNSDSSTNEKIRTEMREEVASIWFLLEQKKRIVQAKKIELDNAVESELSKPNDLHAMTREVDTLDSEQEMRKHMQIVRSLGNALMNDCD